MLPRRIRGVLTSALVWGTLGALGMSAVMPIILLADPRTRSIHALRSLFVDIVPGLFAYMAALGGLLALVVAIVGRSVTTEELTTMRFEAWGGVAGALAGLGLATLQASCFHCHCRQRSGGHTSG
jgi:hypothetical protein